MSDLNDTTREEFREIPGIVGIRVSNRGRVQSRWMPGCRARLVVAWHDLALFYSNGYTSVSFGAKTGSPGQKQVHCLVLLAFVGPRPPGMECRHLDGDAANCCLGNLRYGTKLENEQDKERHGSIVRGIDQKHAKLTDETVREMRSLYAAGAISYKSLGRRFGVNAQTAFNAVKRHTWTHVA